MTASFETIAAAEILQHICGYLDRTSLLYLAAVNKVCNSLANVHLYQEISIDILSGAQLRRDVDRWACLLDRKGSFKHVRRLELNGDMGAKGQVSSEHESRIAELIKQARQEKEIEDQSIWAVEDFPRCRPPDRRPLSQSSQEDRPWEQFAQLLARLSGLKDLIYACANQFPPCLLRVLHEELPSCRLHLKAFHFFSLHQEETDPHEFALVTSPSLYCLWIRYPSIDSSYRGDHHEAAALRVASGLAPNLKEVRLCQYIVSVPRSFMSDRITHTVSPWSGFSQDNFMVLKPSSLIKLELNSEISHRFLSDWNHHADFSALRILKLENIYNGKALGWAAENCNFPSLETLFMGFEYNGRQTAKTERYHITLESFIRSLPPLKNIRITGYLRGKTLETILQQHGNSVYHLWLESRKIRGRFKFDATQVRKLLDTCQVLEELTLNPIPRSKGNREETSIYKLLGGLCNLRKLTLTLDSSELNLIHRTGLIDLNDSNAENYTTPNNPSFDKFHQELADDNPQYDHPRKGHIRDALINSALDKNLARSIFMYISDQKPRNGLPLKYLKLISDGGGDFGGWTSPALGNLQETMKCLGKDWLLTRGVNGNSHDEIIAKEIGEWSENDSAWTAIEPIFRRIWPVRMEEGINDWTQHWRSWPLDISET